MSTDTDFSLQRVRLSHIAAGLFLVLFCSSSAAMAVEVSQEQWEALNKEVTNLRKNDEELRKLVTDLSGRLTPVSNPVDKALKIKYGPSAPVSSKQGKLTMSGFTQIWYYSFQRDNKALFQDSVQNGIQDTNEATDISSFRVRRTELRFTMDISENVSAEIMFDPAREATSFPALPDNQANSSIFKRLANTNVANVQTGAGAAPRILQDAYVLYHDFVPHHEFKIGQFKPPFGDEGIRSSGQLDFVERSFVGLIGDARDQGVVAHGEW